MSVSRFGNDSPRMSLERRTGWLTSDLAWQFLAQTCSGPVLSSACRLHWCWCSLHGILKANGGPWYHGEISYLPCPAVAPNWCRNLSGESLHGAKQAWQVLAGVIRYWWPLPSQTCLVEGLTPPDLWPPCPPAATHLISPNNQTLFLFICLQVKLHISKRSAGTKNRLASRLPSLLRVRMKTAAWPLGILQAPTRG